MDLAEAYTNVSRSRAGERLRLDLRWLRQVPIWGRSTLVLVTALLAAQPLLVLAAAESSLTTGSLVAISVLAALPVTVGAALAAATLTRWGAREPVDLVAGRSLAARLELAEGALARAQERTHELRSTLGGLRLSHELLADRDVSLPTTTRRRLQRLHGAELERVERLLTAHAADRVAPVDLAEVLDPLVELMALQGCDVQWSGTASQVCGRADDITQITHTLLENAVRHGAGRGVLLEVSTYGGWVELTVRDHGPGVPGRLAPVVFDRCARAPGSTGEGLGLHVARRLARDLGGDLRLERRHLGSGAQFVLRLPEARGRWSCLAPAM